VSGLLLRLDDVSRVEGHLLSSTSTLGFTVLKIGLISAGFAARWLLLELGGVSWQVGHSLSTSSVFDVVRRSLSSSFSFEMVRHSLSSSSSSSSSFAV